MRVGGHVCEQASEDLTCCSMRRCWLQLAKADQEVKKSDGFVLEAGEEWKQEMDEFNGRLEVEI